MPAKLTAADSEPLPYLLDRLNAKQRDSFLQVWHKFPAHLREYLTGHLKRHLQERGYITRLGVLRAATSKEIVQLLFGGASGGCTAAAAAAGRGASRLERGEAAARKIK